MDFLEILTELDQIILIRRKQLELDGLNASTIPHNQISRAAFFSKQQGSGNYGNAYTDFDGDNDPKGGRDTHNYYGNVTINNDNRTYNLHIDNIVPH